MSKTFIPLGKLAGTGTRMGSTSGEISRLERFEILTVNWRAYAAYVAGILINAVGFTGASKSTLPHEVQILRCCHLAGREVPLAATRIYELSFFTGFGVSATVYWALNRCFPVVGAVYTFEELDVSGYDESRTDGSRTSTKDAASEIVNE